MGFEDHQADTDDDQADTDEDIVDAEDSDDQDVIEDKDGQAATEDSYLAHTHRPMQEVQERHRAHLPAPARVQISMGQPLTTDIEIWPLDTAFHFFDHPHRLMSDAIKKET